MAHNKCYAICESKCQVETLSKENILANTKPSNAPASYIDDDKSLLLIISNNLHEKIIENTKNPQVVKFAVDTDIENYVHSWFRFNKAMGTSFSRFFRLAYSASDYTLKYLNQPDITNWTRIFLEVFVDNKTIYLRIDGC